MRASQSLGPEIQPLPEGARPTWSVMIPTYNSADYLRQSLASVLSQDPGSSKMQIEVVDDHSTKDDPYQVVKELGAGRVNFHRKPRNSGHVDTFNLCIRRARGLLVHILHSDDLVRNGFYERLGAGLERSPNAGAAFCRSVYVDAEGREIGLSELEAPQPAAIPNWLETIASGQRICTPSVVVRREVYERLGGFSPAFTSAGEDWEMWVRIAAHYPVWFEPEPLAMYRVTRPGSLTASTARTADLVRQMRKACEIIETYLPGKMPAAEAEACLRRARRFYAGWALNHAESLMPSEGVLKAIPLLLQAYRASPSKWMRRKIFDIVRSRAGSVSKSK